MQQSPTRMKVAARSKKCFKQVVGLLYGRVYGIATAVVRPNNK